MITSQSFVKSRIPQIIANSSQRVRDAKEETARRVAQRIADDAPRGESLILSESPEARELADGDWGVYAAFYGRFIESGTAHQPARPWIAPIADSETAPLVSALARAWW